MLGFQGKSFELPPDGIEVTQMLEIRRIGPERPVIIHHIVGMKYGFSKDLLVRFKREIYIYLRLAGWW